MVQTEFESILCLLEKSAKEFDDEEYLTIALNLPEVKDAVVWSPAGNNTSSITMT